MLHLCAYTTLIGQTADTDVPALADDIMTINNNHFMPQTNVQLLAAYVSSATLSRAKISSPKTRQISDLLIRPINVATLPANNPNKMILFRSPFNLNALEEIKVLGTSGLGMGTERFTCLLWLSTGVQPAPIGDEYNLRWTSTTAAVANAWTTITVTYDVQLPAGQYAVIDSECQSTNALAHRLIFDQQYERPGTLSETSLGNRNPYYELDRQMGVWGTFRTTNLPRFQVLANAADAAHEGYLKVVKVG